MKGYQSSTHQTSRICRSLHGNHRQIWTHRAATKSCFFASHARAGAADAPRHDEVCGRFRPTIDLWAADTWRLMVELTNQKKTKYGFDHRKWRFDHMNNGCWVCPKLRIPPCCGSFEGKPNDTFPSVCFWRDPFRQNPEKFRKDIKISHVFCPKTNPEFSLQDISFTMEIARFHHGNHP